MDQQKSRIFIQEISNSQPLNHIPLASKPYKQLALEPMSNGYHQYLSKNNSSYVESMMVCDGEMDYSEEDSSM